MVFDISESLFNMVTSLVSIGILFAIISLKSKGFRSVLIKPILQRRYKRNIYILSGAIDEKKINSLHRFLNGKLKYNDIDLVINSPGGGVFESIYITRMIKNYTKGKITAYVPKFAMSGGSLIALSCDKVYM